MNRETDIDRQRATSARLTRVAPVTQRDLVVLSLLLCPDRPHTPVA